MLAGGLIILAALVLGAFRMFAASLPGYKEDLQAWVSETLNLDVEYDALDLRMGLAGPELAFFDAQLMHESTSEPFIVASRAGIVIDPIALFFDRRLVPTRLVFDGIQVTIERLADGSFAVAGAPQSDSYSQISALDLPEEVSLQIRDSEVLYIDEQRGLRWQFADVRADIEQEFRAISLSLSATPPEQFADRLSITADGFTSGTAAITDDWRAFVAVRSARLDSLRELLPGTGIQSGAGDVSFWLRSDDGRIASALADVALENVVVPFADESTLYDQIEFIGELAIEQDEWTAIFSDVSVTGPDGSWPRETTTSVSWNTADGSFEMMSQYIRLEDLVRLAAALPASELRDRFLALDPRGTLEGITLRRPGEGWDGFEVSGRFSDTGFGSWNGIEELRGLSGELRANTGGGSLDISSPLVSLRHQAIADSSIELSQIEGLVQWREGRDATRILSDELSFEWLGAAITGSGEIELPHDEASPVLEVAADIGTLQVADVLPFVLAAPMHTRLRDWLDTALGEGTLEQTAVEFYGPIEAFPFDNAEGGFIARSQVSGGAVDYVDQWPRAEGFEGVLEFRNAGVQVRGRAQILGNVSEDVTVGIADVRTPVLTVDGNTEGPLGDVLEFLLSAPLIANYLGPDYARLQAPAGIAQVRLDIEVPLPDTRGYQIDAELNVIDGVLALAGFGPQATDINGRLSLADGLVSGSDIQATFLDGSAVASVEPSTQEGYRTQLNLSGEVSADSVVEAFNLPYGIHVAGQTLWDGTVLLPGVPAVAGGLREPITVDIRSNLSGVALRFPAPFQKAPGDATSLGLMFTFPPTGGLQVNSHLGANRHFAAAWTSAEEQDLVLENGIITFGPEVQHPRPPAGLAIIGELPAIDLDEWLALSGAPGAEGIGRILAEADLAFAELEIWDQPLGPVELQLGRANDSFDVSIDSPMLSGDINIPRSFEARTPITATLQRLYWQTGSGDRSNSADPRRWPGLDIEIEDFRVGMRKIGNVTAQIEADPLGLRLVSFNSHSPGLIAEGSGAWLIDRGMPTSRIAVSAVSTDVTTALTDFDLDPVLSGNSAEIAAALRWPGGPAGSWLDHVSGDLSLRIVDGSMLDIEPGAGRLVGLMSIVTLPRRLALDFRDVFNRGFVFDEISADFSITDGDAYTDNLKLAGPAAEIGVAGRTGLRDRDFRQQAVVTAEPGNMLPTVGGLIAGAGVGAALLIFTRIFKEPLKGIGRASYCITGSWDQPEVERLSAQQLEAEELCADLPPGWVTSDPEPAVP